MRNKKHCPEPTPETKEFWEGAQRGELRLQRCLDCVEAYFYPRPLCPKCGGTNVEWFTASGSASLHSYGISMRSTPGFEAPYAIAIVQLKEGPRMLSSIVGVEPQPENLTLDMPLTVKFQHRGDHTIPVFAPAEVA